MLYRRWEKFTREMLAYALCNEDIYEGSQGYNTVKVRRCLLQMVKAAHLIALRTKKTFPLRATVIKTEMRGGK